MDFAPRRCGRAHRFYAAAGVRAPEPAHGTITNLFKWAADNRHAPTSSVPEQFDPSSRAPWENVAADTRNAFRSSGLHDPCPAQPVSPFEICCVRVDQNPIIHVRDFSLANGAHPRRTRPSGDNPRRRAWQKSGSHLPARGCQGCHPKSRRYSIIDDGAPFRNILRPASSSFGPMLRKTGAHKEWPALCDRGRPPPPRQRLKSGQLRQARHSCGKSFRTAAPALRPRRNPAAKRRRIDKRCRSSNLDSNQISDRPCAPHRRP